MFSHANAPPNTFKQRLMDGFIFRLVEEDKVLLVFRDGHLQRIAGPGYVRINPLADHVRLLRTGVRFETVNVTLRSADRVEFRTRLTVTYSFDPRRGVRSVAYNLARQVSQNEEALRGLMQHFTKRAVRKVLGGIDLLDLCSGELGGIFVDESDQNITDLQRHVAYRVGRALQDELRIFGINLLKPGPISIEEISIPWDVEESLRLLRSRNVLASSFSMPIEQIERYLITINLLEKVMECGGDVQIVPGISGVGNLLRQLTNTFLSSAGDGPSPAAKRWNGRSGPGAGDGLIPRRTPPLS